MLFRSTGSTHLLLMDDDIYDVTANDLFTLLEADKEVIGGIMFTSGFPHAMCAFRRFDLTKKVKEQHLGLKNAMDCEMFRNLGFKEADSLLQQIHENVVQSKFSTPIFSISCLVFIPIFLSTMQLNRNADEHSDNHISHVPAPFTSIKNAIP